MTQYRLIAPNGRVYGGGLSALNGAPGSSSRDVEQLLADLAGPLAPQYGLLSAPSVGSLLGGPEPLPMRPSPSGLLAAAPVVPRQTDTPRSDIGVVGTDASQAFSPPQLLPTASRSDSQAAAAPLGAIPAATAPRARAPVAGQVFTDNDIESLARVIFAEGADQADKPGAYLGIGNSVLNRVGAPGFPNTVQGVISQRTPNGTPQFASVGGDLWNKAANPANLTGKNATAYNAALSLAHDLIIGNEYLPEDPTGGATYFYSGKTPGGFFT